MVDNNARKPSFPTLWHPTLQRFIQGLLDIERHKVRRIHAFNLPPGLLGGLYAASFLEAGGPLHRVVVCYVHADSLGRDLAHLRSAVRSLGISLASGRVEVGKNTGDALHYFLPDVGPKDSAKAAEEKYRRCYSDWLQAAREEAWGTLSLRFSAPAGQQPVACATRERQHFLLRLDGTNTRTVQGATADLGVAKSRSLSSQSPLLRDILGEWRDA